MSNKRIISAIDVGTTKICTVTGNINDNGALRIAGVGISPSRGLHKGLVVNINDAKESIRDSVRKAEQASGYSVESAHIGVTGRHINSVNNQGVVAISRNDRLVRPLGVRERVRADQRVPNSASCLLTGGIGRNRNVIQRPWRHLPSSGSTRAVWMPFQSDGSFQPRSAANNFVR